MTQVVNMTLLLFIFKLVILKQFLGIALVDQITLTNWRNGKYSFKALLTQAFGLIGGLHELLHELILIVDELKRAVEHPI